MEKSLKKIKDFAKKNKNELIVFSLIILLAAFLRLYKIREFIIFLGDEGRDALVVRRMIVDHKFTLLGPTASVGGFYLGPIYYYFMIPFLWLFNFDPVGPAIMVALLGTLTVALLYYLMKEWSDTSTAVITSLLYATSPGIVMSSRSSWNPNIMPFFSLFAIFALYKALKNRRRIWFILTGVSFGITIQSHYLGLILGPIIVLATLVNLPIKEWIKSVFVEIIGFVLGASLYLTFEIRHNFPNIRSVIEFITRGGNTTGFRSLNVFWLINDMTRQVFEAVFQSRSTVINLTMISSLLIFLCISFMDKVKNKQIALGYKLIIIWLLFGTLGIGSYKGHLHPHYFGFLFPLPLILIGLTLGIIYKIKRARLYIFLITTLILIMNLKLLPIWGSGSNLINQTKNVANEIINLVQDKDYNLALISSGNSDHAYRYFLEISGKPPQTLEEEVTEQLIVICEDLDNPCKPLGHPLWEIAGFGRAEIMSEIEVPPGIKVVKLSHHSDSVHMIGKPAPQGGR